MPALYTDISGQEISHVSYLSPFLSVTIIVYDRFPQKRPQEKKTFTFTQTRLEHHNKKHINFRVRDSNPDNIINRKVLNEINKDVFGNTTNIRNSSADSQVVLCLTEGRGQARGEIGIATLDINSPQLILCQVSDNLLYSDTLNKIQLLDPVKILLPDTIFESRPLPKLVQAISATFSHRAIIPQKVAKHSSNYCQEILLSIGCLYSLQLLEAH